MQPPLRVCIDHPDHLILSRLLTEYLVSPRLTQESHYSMCVREYKRLPNLNLSLSRGAAETRRCIEGSISNP